MTRTNITALAIAAIVLSISSAQAASVSKTTTVGPIRISAGASIDTGKLNMKGIANSVWIGALRATPK